MAFPSVRSTATTNGSVAATNPVVNLPGTLTAGDTLLLLFRKATGTQSAPTGWTEILNSVADASNDCTIVAWKKVVGTEGATATMTSGSSGGKFACVVWQIQAAADPAVTPPNLAAATGTSTTPNPPNQNPGVSDDYLWFALGAWEGEQTSPPTYPTNYSLSQLAANSGTADVVATNVRVAGAARQLNASSEDPGTFTISASDDWTAATVYLGPAVIPPILNANPFPLLGVGRKLP